MSETRRNNDFPDSLLWLIGTLEKELKDYQTKAREFNLMGDDYLKEHPSRAQGLENDLFDLKNNILRMQDRLKEFMESVHKERKLHG